MLKLAATEILLLCYMYNNKRCVNELDAGSLMHMEGPTMYQQTVTFDPGVLSSLRIRLKKNNFYNFDDLLVALQFKDKVHTVYILCT